VVDGCTKESPATLVDFSISGLRLSYLLEALTQNRGLPREIVLDNAPELTSKAMFLWTQQYGVQLRFIQPGKPVQSAFVESFIGRLRDECLNDHWFGSLWEARRSIEDRRKHYNERRPHSSLDLQTPMAYAWQFATAA
jgi:putative transposase